MLTVVTSFLVLICCNSALFSCECQITPLHPSWHIEEFNYIYVTRSNTCCERAVFFCVGERSKLNILFGQQRLFFAVHINLRQRHTNLC